MSLSPIKSRKQRIINNAAVDLDDVTVSRDITRDKLQQRERSLLQQRREMCDEIIVLMIKNFCNHHAEIFDICEQNALKIEQDTLRIYNEEIQNKVIDVDSAVMKEYLSSIKSVLSTWKGCNTKKSMKTFREYFQCCRTWFDNRKMKSLAQHFWIPMMHVIEELVAAASHHTFEQRTTKLQNVYSDYLNKWILRGVFYAQIKPSNTRLILLVPATLYAKFAVKFNLTSESSTNDVRMRYLEAMDEEIEILATSFEQELSKVMSIDESTNVEEESDYLWHDSLMFYQSPSPQYLPYCETSDHDPFASVAPFNSW